MNTHYSNFQNHGFRVFTNQTPQTTDAIGKLLIATSTAFVLFSGFFLTLFIMAISMILLPLAAIRLWWLKRKWQEQSGVAFTPGATGNIIDGEYKVVDTKQQRYCR